MCLVCVEFNKGKLTVDEAILNTKEIADTDPHKEEVLSLLFQQLYGFGVTNEQD